MTKDSQTNLTAAENALENDRVKGGDAKRLIALVRLAQICEERGEYDRAAELYRRSIGILEAAGKSPKTEKLRIRLRSSLASVYRIQGHYPEAEDLFRRSIALAERTFGLNDLEMATLLNNLAVPYKYMGRFDEAGELYGRAIAITEQALGPDHPQSATLYHNLGGLEHARDAFRHGEPFARKSVEIREKALGPDHPERAHGPLQLRRSSVRDGHRQASFLRQHRCANFRSDPEPHAHVSAAAES